MENKACDNEGGTSVENGADSVKQNLLAVKKKKKKTTKYGSLTRSSSQDQSDLSSVSSLEGSCNVHGEVDGKVISIIFDNCENWNL